MVAIKFRIKIFAKGIIIRSVAQTNCLTVLGNNTYVEYGPANFQKNTEPQQSAICSLSAKTASDFLNVDA